MRVNFDEHEAMEILNRLPNRYGKWIETVAIPKILEEIREEEDEGETG